MAFTRTAVYIGGIAAFVLLAAGIIVLIVTRNSPEKKKWGWSLIFLCVCALVSAAVNSRGVF